MKVQILCPIGKRTALFVRRGDRSRALGATASDDAPGTSADVTDTLQFVIFADFPCLERSWIPGVDRQSLSPYGPPPLAEPVAQG